MHWTDLFKLFRYSFEDDPQTKRDKSQETQGAGVTVPDAVPYVRQDGSTQSSSKGQLRIGQDMVDLSAVSTRKNRYTEYERLRNVSEIEQAMTIIADEACVAGETLVHTLYDGLKSIQWLAENKANEQFFVYSWDFEKNDYTLAIAYEPRLVKKSKTFKILLDDGTFFVATPDHRVLLSNNEWIFTGLLDVGMELKPFYHIPANQDLTEHKQNQFPRILSFNRGWIHERQFIEEWKAGKPIKKYEKINKLIRLLMGGMSRTKANYLSNISYSDLNRRIAKEGFSWKEIKWLTKKSMTRRVIAVLDWDEIDVYDLSVKGTQNFCGESIVFHNCQKDDEGNVLKIDCKNNDVKKELDYLFLHRNMLNMNRKLWGMTKRLCINGDWFGEIMIQADNPKYGILKCQELPPDSMYRIETTKGKLLEFQQGNEGPDLEALVKGEITELSQADLDQCKAIRFSPHQIIHMRLGEDRKTFYPYGQSLIEPARGPAHQLRLMEDAMIVYRLSRAPERRVFYIDIGQLQGHRAEGLMRRMQDLLRKRKVVTKPGDGANAMDERWSAPSVDEDYWLPIRPNSNTRIDTLPGAQNLGEIDDAVYFRNKLFAALNFPANYLSNEDVNSTKVSLSHQSSRFARMIERIQEHIEDGLWDIADRHLKLLGFPTEVYEDLKIKMTLPSEYREVAKMELKNGQIGLATSLKGSMLMSDYDIFIEIMKYSNEKAEELVGRMKYQKLEDATLQVKVQNPQLLGIGVPGAEENQMGMEAGGPMPNLGEPDKGKPEDQAQQPEENPMETPEKPVGGNTALAEPEPEEIRKYDMEIQSYAQDQDMDEPDFSEL